MRIVCYARTSTLDQAREDKVSIPDQIGWARNYALEKGWDFVGEYIEPGVTGDTEPEQRLELSRLIEDARLDKFDIVLVYHSSRLAREPDIGMKVCRVLGQLRKQIYFRNAPIEPVSPQQFSWGINIGSQYMTAFSFIGDFQENVARSERVRAGFQGLAKRGVLTFAPFGYKKIQSFKTDDTGKQRYTWSYEKDPMAANVVKTIFNSYISGKSMRRIMLELNDQRTLPPSGKGVWSTVTIRNILTNPTYKGEVRWGRKLGGKYLQGKSATGKQKRMLTSKDSWITSKGSHPQIISSDEFDLVSARISSNFQLKGRAVSSKGLLTGILKCGYCLRNAYFKTRVLKSKNNLVRSDYICSTHISFKKCVRHLVASKKVHEVVINELKRIAVHPKFRESILKINKTENNQNMIFEKEQLLKNRSDIETRQIRLLDAYQNNTISLQEFGDARSRNELLLTETDNKLLQIDRDFTDLVKAIESKKTFEKTLDFFSQSFASSTLNYQQQIIRSLIASVVITKSKIKIQYRI